MNDYAGLVKIIGAYIDWEDNEHIPLFIRLAEQRMQRDLRLRVMERRGKNTTRPGQDSLWLPDKRIPGDWDVFLEMREVCLAGSPNVNLDYAAPDAFTDLSSETGKPRAYSIVGRSLLFAPAPDAAYTVQLTYYSQIPPLSAEQSTNDVLLNYPDLYLYAALVESVPYFRTSVPAESWVSMYQAAKQDAQYMDSRARFGKNIAARSPRRM